MAQWVEALAAHGYLSLILRAHVKVEEKNRLKKLSSDIHMCTTAHTLCACTHIPTQKQNKMQQLRYRTKPAWCTITWPLVDEEANR